MRMEAQFGPSRTRCGRSGIGVLGAGKNVSTTCGDDDDNDDNVFHQISSDPNQTPTYSPLPLNHPSC